MLGVVFETQCICLYNFITATNETRNTQRAQTSAEHGNPEDMDFGLWTPGSEA